MNERAAINRRDILHGLGAAVSLPVLEALALGAPKPSPPKKQKKPSNKQPPFPAGGPYHGYGAAATGGAGHPTVAVKTWQELRDALQKGNAVIVVKAAEIHIPEKIETTASNITLDGRGATLRGDKIRREMQMLKFVQGRNFIVKNLRLRNGGDNLAFYDGARDIVVDHVSSTGAGDDGISISNDSQNATVTHCFLAGNTRAIFCKYGRTDRITIDHCIISKLWMRAPLLHDIPAFDVRNNLVQEWRVMGVRLSGDNCNGNVMGNIYVAPPDSKGALNRRAIVYANNEGIGLVHLADNEFRGCFEKKIKGTSPSPLPAPPIVPAYTTDLLKLEKQLLSETQGAGCMPRDPVDKAYLAAKEWPMSVYVPYRIPKTGDVLPTQ
jgi:hypothetical protein